jgi:hypothetical protein
VIPEKREMNERIFFGSFLLVSIDFGLWIEVELNQRRVERREKVVG